MNLNKNGTIKRQYIRNYVGCDDYGYDSTLDDWYHVDELPDFELLREAVMDLRDKLRYMHDVDGELEELCHELGLEWTEKKADSRSRENLPQINLKAI